MNLPKNIILALGVLAAAGVSRSQTAPAVPTRADSIGGFGLLGQRYAEVSVGQYDPHGISDQGFVGDLSANVPFGGNIDVGFSYSYSRANLGFGGPLKLRTRSHTLGTSSTFYSSFGNVKPFAGAAIGYQWTRDRVTLGGPRTFEDREDEAVWGLGVGAEIPFGTVTLTPTVTYQDGFEGDSASGFTYGAEAHLWFTRVLGGFVDVTFSDPTGGGRQGWIYKVGARLRF